MDDLDALIAPFAGPLVVLLAVVCVVLVVAVVWLARRTARLDRRLAGLTRDGDGRSLEAVLDAHLDRVDAVARELDDLGDRAAALEAGQRRSMQRVGLVRFNPFEDTGGNQSFALAVLDARGDGFVVSSLHARTGTRVYGKAITGGRSDTNLSGEETEAVRLAQASGSGPGRGA